ncbi:MAG: hypothetical protein ACOC1F_11035 [Myxococcota bacterium]
MKTKKLISIHLAAGVLSMASPAWADDADRDPDTFDFSTLWFLHSIYGSEPSGEYSAFRVSRGYFTAKIRPEDYFAARITMDAHQDEEGDMEVRLKYLYGQFFLGDLGSVITNTNVEYGLVHVPWLDFEQDINQYRMQGTMFVERYGLFNSADFGLTLAGLLGEELSREYQKEVSKDAPGTFGSFAVGVYNGGGYHEEEQNENKVVEGRVSVRPLGPIFPNLQLSYFGLYGKGNVAPGPQSPPDWRVHTGMASFQHEYAVLTATYTMGEGNQKGTQVGADGEALDFAGYSAFVEAKLPWIDSSLIGRYDRFDWDTDGGPAPVQRVIWGAAYHFRGRNTILVDWDWLIDEESSEPIEKVVKATLQVKLP